MHFRAAKALFSVIMHKVYCKEKLKSARNLGEKRLEASVNVPHSFLITTFKRDKAVAMLEIHGKIHLFFLKDELDKSFCKLPW